MTNLTKNCEIKAEHAFSSIWVVSISRAIDLLQIGFYDKTADPTIYKEDLDDFLCLLAFRKYINEVHEHQRRSKDFNEDHDIIFIGKEVNEAP